MKIVIIVLNWNGKEDTIQCLASLRRLTIAHSVLVVDNGSTDDSAREIARAFPDIELIATGSNLGYAEGNNVGLRHALKASPDAILILNNDTVVEPDLLSAFLKRDFPIQGGSLLQMSNPEKLDHIGGMWNSKTGRFDLVAFYALAAEWKDPFNLDYLCGCALFVKTEVFRNVGLFDPRFFLLWEECDWCYRAASKGYSSSFCPEAKIHHRVSASFSGGAPHTGYYWWRNRLLWIDLHCSASERRRLFRMMFPEIFQAFLKYVRRTAKYWFTKASPDNIMQQKYLRAMLAGVRDYWLRKFGEGPQWLKANILKAAAPALTVKDAESNADSSQPGITITK